MSASDAALIELCDEFLRRNEEMLRLSKSFAHCDQLFIRLTSSILKTRDLLQQIEDTPVATIAGWKAKFRVSIAALGDQAGDDLDVGFARATMREFVWGART
jgi:hypothetical protein